MRGFTLAAAACLAVLGTSAVAANPVLAAAKKAPAPPAQPAPPPEGISGHLDIGAINNEPLSKIARAHDLSTPSVMAANWGIDEILPQTNDKVLLPLAHVLPKGLRDGILINRAEYRLYYFKDGALVTTMPIGVGLPALPTPLGKTTIIAKKKNPTWIPTSTARREHPDWPTSVEPGITNPLGAYALYLGWSTYLIHGSTNDFGIGRPFTRGCIRVWADDIENLFNLVPVGTHVEVVDQPVKLGWHKNELFLEAHPSLAQLDELRATLKFSPEQAPDLRQTILTAAGKRADDIDWDVVSAALDRRAGIPVQITSPKSDPVNLFEQNVAVAEVLGHLGSKAQGFAPQAPAPKPPEYTPEQKRVIEQMRNEQLRKDPYNI